MTGRESRGAVLLVRVGNPARFGIGHPNAPSPPYGLKYLQALLRRHGRRSILRDGLLDPGAMEPRRLVPLLRDSSASAAVIDAEYGAAAVAVELARTLQAAGIEELYLAGSHPEAAGEVGCELPPFRAVVGIEPDIALAGALCGHETTLRDLPIPFYSTDEIRGYRHIYLVRLAARARYGHVLATRGCPHRCAFCTAVLRTTAGAELRTRSIDSVHEEIQRRRREGANVIVFGDDDLTADRSFAGELAERLAAQRSPIPFIAHARVDDLDAAQIDRLARGGCEMLLFGVESAAPAVLAALGKTPRPEAWGSRAEEVFARCREAGIRTHAMFILGTPGECAADVQDSLRLARRLEPDSVQVHFYTAYPGVAVRPTAANRRPSHALVHYETPRGAGEGMSGESLLAWRREFYRSLSTDRRWWAKQLRELAPFLAYNPDIALQLAHGMRRLTTGLP